LKNPPVKGSPVPDYFDEMLARIRDIRASERRMYLRVREIFAMAADYEPTESETSKFFSVIQNKLHFASTGMNAAELIQSRANHQLPNIGLTVWKGDKLRKTDIAIAKNYLKEDEIEEPNRIVTMWLDFAEDQAKRRKQVFMKDWEQKLDEFLRFNERRGLPNAGRVSKQAAEDHAKAEFDKYEVLRREYKESIGEVETIRQLEHAAKMLTKGNRKNDICETCSFLPAPIDWAHCRTCGNYRASLTPKASKKRGCTISLRKPTQPTAPLLKLFAPMRRFRAACRMPDVLKAEAAQPDSEGFVVSKIAKFPLSRIYEVLLVCIFPGRCYSMLCRRLG
jgi:hypothetical protein